MRLGTIMTLAFCVVAIVPMLLFWFWPNSDLLKNETKQAQEHHLVVARSLSAEFAHYHKNLVTTFGSVAEGVVSQSHEAYEFPLLETLGFKQICVVDAATRKVVEFLPLSDGRCVDRYSEDQVAWFNKHLNGAQETTIFTPVTSTSQFGSVFFSLYRVREKLVIGILSIDYFREAGARIRFGDLGYAAIVDNTGQVVSHPNRQWEDQLENISFLSPVQKAISGGSGIDSYQMAELGGKVIAGFASVEGLNWGVMVSQPESEISARVIETKYGILTPMLIGLVTAVILAFFATRILSFPIVQIVQAMEKIGNGQLRAHEEIREKQFQPLEFRKAREAIRVMSHKFQENIDTISRHAYLDGITGLPNRECFKVLAQQEIERIGLAAQRGALLFLDLDGFKQVNDVYGHRSGDDLLQGFARRLHTYCGSQMKRHASGVDNAINILPARLGGDEFVVFMGNVGSPALVEEFSQGLFRHVFGSFKLHNGVTLQVTGSVGGALFPAHAEDFDELLRLADIAMYQAKKSGKAKFCMHEMQADLETANPSLAYELET